MALWTIRANYDPEAQVWYSIDGDVPRLAISGETIEEPASKASAILPDLLEIHVDDFFDKSRLIGPHRIRLLAFHEREYDVAA